MSLVLFATVGVAPVSADDAEHKTVVFADGSSNASVQFKPTSQDFPNPERGFYMPAGYGSQLYLDQLNHDRLRDLSEQGYRLIFVVGNLKNFRHKDISSDYIGKIADGFRKVRESGMKAIVRFAYTWDENGGPDASLDRIRRHIRQLSPVLKENEDVIEVVQAGFIGHWGEWHSSTSGVDDIESQKKIIDMLLDSVPTSRQIQVRYPYSLWRYRKEPPSVGELNLNPPPSYTRIGIHNDCFLANSQDWGTYPTIYPPGDDELRSYAKNVTKVTSFGGETCVPLDGARLTCDDILSEGREYHATYLNEDYYKTFVIGWKAEGCFDEIAKRLGYRLVLHEIDLKLNSANGGVMLWRIALANEGWARPVNSRSLVLRFQSNAETIDHKLSGTNIRYLAPGETVTLSGSFKLPTDLRRGSYKVFLGAPDPSPILANDTRYNIRFANADQVAQRQIWVADQGFMDLGERLTVK